MLQKSLNAVSRFPQRREKTPHTMGLGAESEEKHEPVSDVDTAVVDSVKALDPDRPIREA